MTTLQERMPGPSTNWGKTRVDAAKLQGGEKISNERVTAIEM